MLTKIKDIIRFIKTQSSSGIILMLSALAALITANFTPEQYHAITHYHNELFSTHLLVNDILMTLFFLLVGLEIKREFIEGELSSIKNALLPVIAAVGGMIVPAVIYLIIVSGNPTLHGGWAIPTATDIAFSLGVLSLFGNRVPVSLTVFLTGLAIIDDLFAVLIIALFYSTALSMFHMIGALLCTLVLTYFNRAQISRLSIYFLVAPFLFWFVFKSGIHATIAGVIFALCIPLAIKDKSPLADLEHKLHPWVAYAILPIFAFCNAGVSLKGLSIEHLLSPLALATGLGLFLGKQIGVFGTSYLAIKNGICALPQNSSWLQLYGVSVMTGIGFTMSLFVGMLSFTESSLINELKVGVIAGSLFSALLGSIVIRVSSR